MDHTHGSEIWGKTDCQTKEGDIRDGVRDHLLELGFENQSQNQYVSQDQKSIVQIQMVDDIHQPAPRNIPTPYMYNKNFVIITDNYVSCPTQYKIIKLPESFFGIYCYEISNLDWLPDRDFSFCVNRLDGTRLLLLLDLAWQIDLARGYVNFNCQHRYSDQTWPNIQYTPAAVELHWNSLQKHTKHLYKQTYESVVQNLPMKNYDLEFDLVYTRSWLNIVAETYAYDNSVSLSEKIFRALLTPVPWTVCAGRNTVAYLESLGFDCLRDLVGHDGYDFLLNSDNKIQMVVHCSLEAIKQMKNKDFGSVKSRCQEAARHNYQILKNMQNSWPADFQTWLHNIDRLIEPN